MSINSRVITALNGVIVADIKPPASPGAQYATFTTMSTPISAADDAVDGIAHYVYLNLYSSINYFTMLTAIHSAMTAAGFIWYEEREIYEADTQTYNVAMTWVYTEAV
jgi:hypothetical protein